MVDIEFVHPDPVFIADQLTTHHLPVPGDTWFYGEPLRKEPSISDALFGRDSPWPHETKAATQQAEQLWKLIDAIFPQKTSYSQYSWVMLKLVVLSKFGSQFGIFLEDRVSILDHGAKFPVPKSLSATTYNLTAIEHRPGILNRQQQRDDRG